jgi:hypothetical protein
MHLMMTPEYGWFIGHIRGTNLDRRNFSESFAQTVGLLYTFVHMSAYAAMGRARQAAQGAVKNTYYFILYRKLGSFAALLRTSGLVTAQY